MSDSLTDTEDECLEKCFNEPECNWYTYDTIVDYCLLTEDCIPQNATVDDFIGQKECYQAQYNNTSKIPNSFEFLTIFVISFVHA